MSITYKFYCIESTMKKVTALDKRYATFRVAEIPNMKITYNAKTNDNGCYMHYINNTLYQETANITGVCGTVYYIVLRIDLYKISAKEMRAIYPIINESVYKYYYNNEHNKYAFSTYIPILAPPKNEYSAIYFKISKAHEKLACSDTDLITGTKYVYRLDESLTSSIDTCWSDALARIKENYPIYAYRDSSGDFPIVTYTFILLNPYDQKCIQHLKKIYAELTNDTPLIGWNDEIMEYIYRTEDDSPFINKKELEELIYKLEHDEDILPKKQHTNPTPVKEIDQPKPIKRSSNNMEPGRIRSRKSASPSKIKEAIKETTGYVNPYEDLADSSSSEDLSETPTETSEPKTKIDPKMLDCIALDYEPVKPLHLTAMAENVNIFLVVYAFIMTVLVTIGMAKQ